MSEKISYVIFFVIAMTIVSVAVYIERPESLSSAIPSIEQDAEDNATETDSEDSGDMENDITQNSQEAPEVDSETNDDVNATQSGQEEPEGDGDGETNDD